ncbi:MAG TPA: hypothetical protein VFJ82_12875 [Longimicrobium sp.]|nr:hypothetical protein [Longimicrobium sp.]
MNRIELRLQPGFMPGHPVVQVLIDGSDLVALARQVELPHATAEGKPQIAGAYQGLDPRDWADLPRWDDGRRALYRCECGEVDCWPLIVRITRRDDGTVSWSEFRQPHRRAWSHDALGPFIFDAAEYDRAVEGVMNQAG